MTTNAELIRHIQELKKIRPRKDWVLLTKEQIFSQYPVPEVQPRKISWAWFFQPKPAFAALMSLIFLAGTFVLAQNSLPGDPLYAIKKIKERGQAVFVSEEELPRYNLEIANKLKPIGVGKRIGERMLITQFAKDSRREDLKYTLDR